MGAFKTTCTSAFVKQEMTFEPKMSRMISAREETIRQISAVPYKYVEEQIYDNPHFIKKCTDAEVS